MKRVIAPREVAHFNPTLTADPLKETGLVVHVTIPVMVISL
jgi:hypothetical protein